MALVKLYEDKGRFNITKTLFKFVNSNKQQILFLSFKYSNYLEIRLKLNKNQTHKYNRYGIIPTINYNRMANHKTVTNQIYFSFKGRYKSNGEQKININGQIYLLKILKDSYINLNESKLKHLILNQIFY